MKFTAAVALVGALALAPAVMAADQGASNKSAVSAPGSSVTNDLNKLIRANLQTVANLRADLPALRHRHGATFVWLVIIQDRTFAANLLADEVKKAGGTPDLTIPAAESANVRADDLIKMRLQSSLRLMKMVQESENRDGPKMLPTLKKVETKMRANVNNLICLKKGYPITGA